MFSKQKLNEVIFGTENKAGCLFNLILLWMIVGSILVVMLDNVSSIYQSYHTYLYILKWIFTILFTLEYLLRIYSSKNRFNYI